MDGWLDDAQRAWGAYYRAAVDPLHGLTWQTGSLFLTVLLSAALIALWIARASWRFSKPTYSAIRIRRAPHTYKDHVRVSPRAYMNFHGRSAQTSVTSDVVKSDRAKDASRYYVVTVVEDGALLPLVSKEMHLHFAMGKYTVPEGFAQFDDSALSDIRLNNSSADDDELGTEIAGSYNIYIRKVRWWDVRHWLAH